MMTSISRRIIVINLTKFSNSFSKEKNISSKMHLIYSKSGLDVSPEKKEWPLKKIRHIHLCQIE